MTPTDSQDREVPAEGLPAERELEGVPLGDDPADAGMGLLAVEARIHVRPPAEHEALDVVQEVGDVPRPPRCEDEREAARRLDGAHVVVPQLEDVRFLGVADGQADGGAAHMRSGIGMPRRARRAVIWRTNAATIITR